MGDIIRTDEELVQSLRSGSREAFGELYSRHKGALLDYCCHLLKDNNRAEDAVHETFLMVWNDIHSLNSSHSFRSWIFSIARHRGLNHIRDRKPYEELTDDSCVDDTDPFEILVSNDRTARFAGLLEMMKPGYKELIVLKDYEGLSYTEIATVTGLSLASVRVHLYRARKALARVYSKNYGEKI